MLFCVLESKEETRKVHGIWPRHCDKSRARFFSVRISLNAWHSHPNLNRDLAERDSQIQDQWLISFNNSYKEEEYCIAIKLSGFDDERHALFERKKKLPTLNGISIGMVSKKLVIVGPLCSSW